MMIIRAMKAAFEAATAANLLNRLGGKLLMRVRRGVPRTSSRASHPLQSPNTVRVPTGADGVVKRWLAAARTHGMQTGCSPADVAIVIVGESGEHAVDLPHRNAGEAACPVTTVLDGEEALELLASKWPVPKVVALHLLP